MRNRDSARRSICLRRPASTLAVDLVGELDLRIGKVVELDVLPRESQEL
jgi:hypothetical protein